MKTLHNNYCNSKQGYLPLFLSDCLDLLDSVLTFDRLMGGIDLNKYLTDIPEYTTGRLIYNPVNMLKTVLFGFMTSSYCSLRELDTSTFVYGSGKRKSKEQRHYEHLTTFCQKLQEYIQKIEICGPNRNSYSKTDNSATFMRIKTDYMGNDQKNFYGVGEVRFLCARFQSFIHNRYKKGDAKKLNRVFSHSLLLSKRTRDGCHKVQWTLALARPRSALALREIEPKLPSSWVSRSASHFSNNKKGLPIRKSFLLS